MSKTLEAKILRKMLEPLIEKMFPIEYTIKLDMTNKNITPPTPRIIHVDVSIDRETDGTIFIELKPIEAENVDESKDKLTFKKLT